MRSKTAAGVFSCLPGALESVLKVVCVRTVFKIGYLLGCLLQGP